jgi:hypothetical protein
MNPQQFTALFSPPLFKKNQEKQPKGDLDLANCPLDALVSRRRNLSASDTQ